MGTWVGSVAGTWLAALRKPRVVAHPTQEFLDFIAVHGTPFEDAAAARQRDGGDHNSRETPLFAASIERRALARRVAGAA